MNVVAQLYKTVMLDKKGANKSIRVLLVGRIHIESASRSINGGKLTMADSVYKVIELVGTSKESWEKAAVAAVSRAGKTLRDLRVAEVGRLGLQLKDGKVEAFRARVSVSFKYEGGT
jgi:flavin-binding protein dodecin